MTWGLFFEKDPQSFKDFTCREHIHRKNKDLYDFFGDLVGSVVSISKQRRKDSPRGIMMTELLSLKVVSNQTSGLVVGGGRGVDQALVLSCTNPCQSINQLYLNTVNGSASWFSDMPCDNYNL